MIKFFLLILHRSPSVFKFLTFLCCYLWILIYRIDISRPMVRMSGSSFIAQFHLLDPDIEYGSGSSQKIWILIRNTGIDALLFRWGKKQKKTDPRDKTYMLNHLFFYLQKSILTEAVRLGRGRNAPLMSSLKMANLHSRYMCDFLF